MRCDARQYARLARHGPATAVSVRPTGTAVTDYQVPLGQRHSLREVGVIGLPSWSEKQTQTETWVKVPRLSATCPRRVVAFDGGRGSIDMCMEFGDEFEGAALDTAKWTAVGGGYTIANGAITIADTVGTQRILTSGPTFSTNFAIRVRKSATIETESYVQIGFAAGTPCALSDVYSDTAGVYVDKLYTAQSSGTLNAGNLGYDTSPHIYDLIRNGSASVIYRRDGGTPQTNTTNLPTGALPVYSMVVRASGASGGTSTIYWIAVRKYVTAEPLAGTAKPSATNRALSRPLSAARAMQMAVAG